MQRTFINQIATAVPNYEFNPLFLDFLPELVSCPDTLSKIQDIASTLPIKKRYSVISDLLGDGAFYDLKNFPSTEKRMQAYKKHALPLARKALDKLFLDINPHDISHIVISSCTGFYSPGIDIEIIKAYDLNPNIERTLIGFMGCHAAFNTMKTAQHIIKSEPNSKVLMLNLELSSLHLQTEPSLAQLISFLLFADGCSASIISNDAAYATSKNTIELKKFNSHILPNSLQKMTWDIEDEGFGIHLDKSIPLAIRKHLRAFLEKTYSLEITNSKHWALHPGGKAILEVIQESLNLSDTQMQASYDVFSNYGNMSSATVMFVLEQIMNSPETTDDNGCAIAFGPGLCIESLSFKTLKAPKLLSA